MRVQNPFAPFTDTRRRSSTSPDQRRGSTASPSKPPPQGRLIVTGSLADLAIGGGGAFLLSVDGNYWVTRIGTLTMRPGEPIGHEAGGLLLPTIVLPEDAVTVVVSAFGDVLAVTSPGECRYLGTIQLVSIGPSHRVRGTRMLLSDSFRPAQLGWPGSQGYGHVLQGAVELPAGLQLQDLGTRFADEEQPQGIGGSLRLTSSTAVRVAQALRSARKRKESRLDISLARSQAARLVGSVSGASPQSIVASVAKSQGLIGIEPASAVLAQLARRLSPQGIVDAWLYNRRYEPDRFTAPVPNGENGRRAPQDQELQVAQARARLDWSGAPR
jgi:hypothetical protein